MTLERRTNSRGRRFDDLVTSSPRRSTDGLLDRRGRSGDAETLVRAPVPLLSLDASGRMESANAAAAALFGVERAALPGQMLTAVARFDEGLVLLAAIQRCVERGAQTSLEVTLRLRDDRDRAVALAARASRVADALGRPRCSLVLFDVSRWRTFEQQEQMIASAAHALASTFEHEASIAAVARQVVPVFADLCFTDLLRPDGTFARVASHAAVEGLVPTPVDDCPQREALRTRAPVLVHRRATAPLFGLPACHAPPRDVPAEAASIILVPLFASGRPAGVTTFVSTSLDRMYGPEDVVLARRLCLHIALAVERAARMREAQQAIVARDAVVAMAARDLRGPLAVMQLNVQTLLAGCASAPRDADDRALVEGIGRSAFRMTRLIDDLDGLAATLEARTSLVTDVHLVKPLVDDAVAHAAPQAAAKGIRLTSSVAPDASAVICDRQRILQVFDAILGDAVASTPERGSIHVSATCADDEVRFDVVDEGAPERNRGAGAQIAKTIVGLHQGRTLVEPTRERAAFSFTLLRANA